MPDVISESPSPPVRDVSRARRTYRFAARLTALAVLLATAYFLHAGLNAYSLITADDIGVTLQRAKDSDQATLRQSLQDDKAVLERLASRPLRWLLHDEVLQNNRRAAAVVDLVTGQTKSDHELDSWIEPADAWLIQPLRTSEAPVSKAVLSEALNLLGTLVRHDCERVSRRDEPPSTTERMLELLGIGHRD